MIVTIDNGVVSCAYRDNQRNQILAQVPDAVIYRVSDSCNPAELIGTSAVYGDDGEEIIPAIPPMTEEEIKAIEEPLDVWKAISVATGLDVEAIRSTLEGAA